MFGKIFNIKFDKIFFEKQGVTGKQDYETETQTQAGTELSSLLNENQRNLPALNLLQSETDLQIILSFLAAWLDRQEISAKKCAI